MRLQRLAFHRLTRVLVSILPAAVAVLIAIPVWNYWSRARAGSPQRPLPGDMPSDVAVQTDNFAVTRSENGKDVFTIKAKKALGYKDDRRLLEDVEVTVYAQKEGEPARKIRSDECSHDKNDNIVCTRNIHVEFDNNTFGKTEQVTYNRELGLISSGVRTYLEQPGQMTGEAGRFEYSMDSGLLSLADNVHLELAEGGVLRAGLAVFQRKENWATVADAVEIRSSNGVVRGASGRAELQPNSYRPTKVTIEGGVRAESGAGSADGWTLRSDWLEGNLSTNNTIEHVLTRGNAVAERGLGDDAETLKGREIEADLDADGRIRNIEARQAPEFNGKDRRLTARNTIVIRDASSPTITTDGPSVLHAGDSTIDGRDFTIEQMNGGRIFRTRFRATLAAAGRTTVADSTMARFDDDNQLIELNQDGKVTLKEGTREGEADKLTVTQGGTRIVLEALAGLARVKDPERTLKARKITLDQEKNSFIGEGDVDMVDVSSPPDPVHVTAAEVHGSEERMDYAGGVEVHRGAVEVKADEATFSSKDSGFEARGSVRSKTRGFNAASASMRFSDASDDGQTAHYTGRVVATKSDRKGQFTLHTEDMTVRFKSGEIDSIAAMAGVDIEQGAKRGKGDQALYDKATGEVTLTGTDKVNAEVRDKNSGGNLVKGYRIRMSSGGDAAVVEPLKPLGTSERRAQ